MTQEKHSFNVQTLRKDFPILEREVYGKPLVYLDSAASAQKPQQVIEAMTNVMESEFANVHRGLHYLSNAATSKFEDARETVRRFLNARKVQEIVFTGNATDAINLVATSFGKTEIGEGDEIILTELEHHSNIVPWHMLREQKGAVLKWLPMTDDGQLELDQLSSLITPRTKLIAVTHMSNALGTITPIKAIVTEAHANDIPVLVDGSQSAVHMPIDVQDLGCDFFVFTGHKTYGPTGIGVLYGNENWLERLPPYRGGGEMISLVSKDKISWADLPHKFEAGTPAIIEGIGLGAALEYMMTLDREAILEHEMDLLRYATDQLSAINSLRVFGPSIDKKGSIISFELEGAHAHDVSTIIDRSGIAVRAGHHCAQILMDRLDVAATARASFAMYNTRDEVDALVQALDKAREILL